MQKLCLGKESVTFHLQGYATDLNVNMDGGGGWWPGRGGQFRSANPLLIPDRTATKCLNSLELPSSTTTNKTVFSHKTIFIINSYILRFYYNMNLPLTIFL